MDNLLDFYMAPYGDVCKALGSRLKAQRIAQSITQDELAARAGISVGTVKNLESKGQSSIESFVRLALTLGLADDLQALFKLKISSIAQMEQAEQARRVRAPRKKIK